MTDDRKNTASAEETGEGTLGSLIKRTAVITVLCFLVIVSLIASLIGCFFPKAYMELYRSVGAYGISSVYAEEAFDRAVHEESCDDSNCDYIILVTSGVDVTSIAFDDNTNAVHARRLLKFADAYMAASCHGKHSAAMDAYYANVYKDKKDVTTLVAVYGYDGYVAGRQTAALGVLAESEQEYADRLDKNVSVAVDTVTTVPNTDKSDSEQIDEILDNLCFAFDTITACAQYRVESLYGYSDKLFAAYLGYTTLFDTDITRLSVVRFGYKLYRFVSAMETANGDAAFEQTWNKELVSQAFDDYYNTITKYTTQEV